MLEIFNSRGGLRPPASFTPEQLVELNPEQRIAFNELHAAMIADEMAESDFKASEAVLKARVRDLNDARTHRAKRAPVTAIDAAKAHLRAQRRLVLEAHGINPDAGDPVTRPEGTDPLLHQSVPSPADTEVEDIETEVVGLRAIYYAAKEKLKITRHAVARTVQRWRNVSGSPDQATLHKLHAQAGLRHRQAVANGTEQEYREPNSVGPSRLDQTMAAGRGGPISARYNSARRGGRPVSEYGMRVKLPSDR